MTELSDLLQESKPIDEAESVDFSAENTTAIPSTPKPSTTTVSSSSGIVGLLVSLPAKVMDIVQKIKPKPSEKGVSTQTPKPAPSEPLSAPVNTPAVMLSQMGSSKPTRKKALLIGASIILFFGVIYLGSEVVKTLRTNGILPSDGLFGGGEPTPTLGEIQPAPPSIYAVDEVVLQLEEDINTLDGQLSSTVLKENTLDPPKLDYDIRF